MKLHRQMLDRSLALRLMALIVTIAALCLPSSAGAHDGHGPGHRAHGVSRIATRAPAVAPADPTLLAPSHFTPSAIVRSGVPRLSAPAACGESCCTGGCDGACCSAIGLAPAEGGAAPAPALTGPVPDGAASARIEGAPGCLPEPPRPLA